MRNYRYLLAVQSHPGICSVWRTSVRGNLAIEQMCSKLEPEQNRKKTLWLGRYAYFYIPFLRPKSGTFREQSQGHGQGQGQEQRNCQNYKAPELKAPSNKDPGIKAVVARRDERSSELTL